MAVNIFEEERLPGAQQVRGTVLFADLRGFTTLAERLSAPRVVTLLEEFFSILAGAVERYGGAVFHLAGDSVMAGFGLADREAGPVQATVDAARLMVASFAAVSPRWERSCGVATGIGVGVHVGDLACAELGPASFRRRTLIGDTVNVAARLCQRARAGEILFSASVAEVLEASAAKDVIALPDFVLRGRESPVRIFCVPASSRLSLPGQQREVPVRTPYAVV
jgi:adenylate cyclase